MLPTGVYLHRLARRLTRRDEITTDDGSYAPRPSGGPLVWCHVGNGAEFQALLGFIRQLTQTRDDLCFLITSRGEQKADLIPADLSDLILLQTLPDDSSKSVRGFLDHWRPDLLVWMGQHLEISLLAESHARDVPAFWINARSPLSDQPGLRWARGTIRKVALGFRSILVENDISAAELSRIGLPVSKLRLAGALQEQTQPPSCNLAERDDMANILGARPIWLALNCSAEEDVLILAAHRQVMRKSHRLLLVLVPDDPSRAADLAHRLEDDGWVVALRSEGQEPTAEVQVYIADQPDEEGLWMHLSPVTLIGQTLTGGACGNPNEPASLGSVIMFGPRVDRYISAFKRLNAAGAACKVKDVGKLADEVEYLLQPERAAEMAMAAWDITTSGAEVASLVEELVFETLDTQGV